MQKRTFVLSVSASILLATALTAEPAGDVKPIPVHVQEVKPRPFREMGSYFGNVSGMEQATLVAYQAGRVEKTLKKVGETVAPGDSLCEIEKERFSVLYQSTVLAEKIAKQQLDRTRLHRKSGGTSRLQEDQGRLAWNQAQAQRIEAKKVFDGALCVSPISGVVVERHIEPHQDVSPGQPTYTIAQLDMVKVYVGIPESVIEGFEVGAQATAFLKVTPKRKFPGRIVAIAQGITRNERFFQAEVHLNNAAHILKPGHTVRVEVVRLDRPSAIVVPVTAILTKVSRKVVMVVEDSVAREREVTIQSMNKDTALISSGLKIKDRLITKGHHQVIDGSPVKVVEPGPMTAAQ